MYTEVFASRLKNSREHSGLTQKEISKALKIGQSTYAHYESGSRQPSLEVLAMLSKAFDVSTDWLLGLSTESTIGSLQQAKELREREQMLRKLEKEALLERKIWG